MVDVIKFLQRILNTGDLERFAAKLGINIPVHQLLKIAIMNLVPVGGAYLYNYAAEGLENFKKTPAEKIWNDLKTSNNEWSWKEDFSFSIGGKKFVIKKDETISDGAKAVAGIALFGFLGYMFLSERG